MSELRQELSMLKAEMAWIKQVMESQGIKGPWVSPQRAADILSTSRSVVMGHISRAERFRAAGLDCECRLGTHYRILLSQGEGKRPTYEVNFREFAGLLAIAPDQLRVG